LDIDMPELSGLELATLLRDKVYIVFITGHSNYGAAAFEYDAVDFIVKPVTYERFLKAIQKVKDRISVSGKSNSADDHTFYITDVLSKKLICLRYDEVDFMESSLNYVKIFTAKQYMVHSSLKEMENSLPQPQFIRIHKSYIINSDRIESVNANMVKTKGGAVISVGESFKKSFFDELNKKFLKKKGDGATRM
jgi:DNA-binding LytR/AlgR family response regulator